MQPLVCVGMVDVSHVGSAVEDAEFDVVPDIAVMDVGGVVGVVSFGGFVFTPNDFENTFQVVPVNRRDERDLFAGWQTGFHL